MTKYFIPRVIEVKGTKIPSTPFNDQHGNALFLGDVIEVNYNDEGKETKETYLVTLKDGLYQGISKNANKSVELWYLNTESIAVLGSSDEKPELLDLLTI